MWDGCAPKCGAALPHRPVYHPCCSLNHASKPFLGSWPTQGSPGPIDDQRGSPGQASALCNAQNSASHPPDREEEQDGGVHPKLSLVWEEGESTLRRKKPNRSWMKPFYDLDRGHQSSFDGPSLLLPFNRTSQMEYLITPHLLSSPSGPISVCFSSQQLHVQWCCTGPEGK